MAKPLSVILVLLFCFQTGLAEWVKQSTNSLSWFKDIFFVDASKGWIVGSDGAMLSTSDGGRSWTRAAKFTTDNFIQIHFTDEMTGWLLCERDIYARGSMASSYLRRTTDGGTTWDTIEFAHGGRERVTRLIFNTDGEGTGIAEGGVLYKLQEDGTSWKKSQSSVHFLLLDGAFSDEFNGAIVGAGGTILFTEDSGLTWERASLLGDAGTRFNGVYFADQKTGWAVGTKGRIFRSNGDARLWRQVNSGTTADLNDVFFSSAPNGWAVGDAGTIIHTRDGGRTWTAADSHVTHRLEKIVFTGDRGWAVGFGGTLLEYDLASSSPNKSPAPALQRRN
jgi:photosystem II stability/assembly factor-like uncharacterized protein